MHDMWISIGDGFLLVFAINDRDSFEVLKSRHDMIIKGKHGANCPIILVGNKKDLENERKISYDEGKNLADLWGIEYIETSVKNNLNCNEVFERIAKQIIKSKAEGKSSKKNCLII